MRLSLVHSRIVIVTAAALCALIVVFQQSGSFTQAESSEPALVPNITAVKSISFPGGAGGDVNSDENADPGDTITYSVLISNTGTDATGVIFSDTLQSITSLVGGSLTASPVAANDAYSASGNIRISVADGGGDLLGNDVNPLTGTNSGLSISVLAGDASAPFAGSSAQGGQVTSAATDGSFTYNPPPGYEGADTFTYTVLGPGGVTSNATVTVTVSGMIWFVNNTAAACTTLAAGCGRLTNPFSSLAAFHTLNNGTGNNPAANDNIFVYESATDYVGPVTLLNGQKFIGQDATASLSTISGVTPPSGSDPLPATNSGNGTIVNVTSLGVGITTGQNNTLRGFAGGNSTSDIDGSGFGTLNISDVTLNGTGRALSLTTGTLAATIGSISSTNSATTGISLTSVSGTLTTGSTTITNPTGAGISVNTSSGTLNFANTAATLSGGTGVSLTTNTGTITFGDLDISPDSSQRGLVATGNTNTITTTSGTVTTTNATAVEIIGTSSVSTTPLNMTLTSVTASGTGANGIVLQNTSGTGFSVVGDGSNTAVGGNSTGGTISGRTGADGAIAGSGVYLDNVQNVSLRRMTINGTNQNFGIRGFRVNNFTLEYSTVNGTQGTSASFDNYGEGAVMFGDDLSTSTNGMTGVGTVTNCSFAGGSARNFSVVNTAGTLNRLTVTGSTFGLNQSTGSSSFAVEARNAGTTANVTVTGSTFTGSPGDAANFTGQTSTTMDVIFGGATGTRGVAPGNTITNNHPQNNIGGGNLTFASQGVMNFHVLGNTMRDANGSAVTFFKANAGTVLNGYFNNNEIGNAAVLDSGSKTGNGIFVSAGGTGTMSYTITNNLIHQIHGNAHIYADNTGGSYTANFNIANNTLDTPVLPSWFAGVAITNGSPTSSDTINVCAAVNNNLFDVGSGQLGVIVGSSGANGGHTFNLPTYGGGANLANVESFIQANNTMNLSVADAYVDAPATAAAFTGVGTSCSTPASLSSPLAETDADPAETPAVDIIATAVPLELQNMPKPEYMTPLARRIYFLKHNVPYEDPQPGSDLRPNSGGPAPNSEVKAEMIYGFDDKLSFLNTAYLPFDGGESRTVSNADLGMAIGEPGTVAAGSNADMTAPETARQDPSTIVGLLTRLGAMISPSAYAQEQKSVPAKDESPITPESGETITVNGAGAGFTLPGGKSVTITFKATVDAGPYAAGINNITNTANVTAAGGVNVNSNTTSLALDAAPDLTVSASDGAATTQPGGTVAYTLNYSNVTAANGQGATGVTLTETVPVNTSFNVAASTAGWVCAPNNSAGSTCTLAIGALAAGGSGSATFAVNVLNALPAGAVQISNTATIAEVPANTNGTDRVPADNSSSDTTPIIGNWLGGTSSDWHTAANWSNATVPPSGNNVSIPAGGNVPTVTTSDVTLTNLVLNGQNLSIQAGRTVTVTGLLNLGINSTDGAGTLDLGSTGTISRTTGQVNSTLNKVFTGNGLFVYPVGTSGAYSPVDVTVTAGTGSLSVRANTGTAPATPALPSASTLQRYWSLSGSGITADVLWHYLQTDVAGTETNYRLIRVVGTTATAYANIAPCPGAGSRCVDSTANTIFVGGLSTFSNWTAGELAPTAANVGVSGRVLDANGRGVSLARVLLTDENGTTVVAMTNPFGYYRFLSVQAGETYVVSVESKRFEFAPRAVNVADEVTGLDFVPIN